MVAYDDKLVSVLHILDTILRPGGPRFFHSKSLHQMVRLNFLLDFLGSASSCRTNEESDDLKRKISDATNYEAAGDHVLESNHLLISHNPELIVVSGRKPTSVSNLLFTVQIVLYVLVRRLTHVGVQKAIVVWIQILMPVVRATAISDQNLLPAVSFQNVMLFGAHILIPFTARIFTPVFILSAFSFWVLYLIYGAVLKGISFADPYERYFSQPEYHDLLQVMDAISIIIKNRKVMPIASSIRDRSGMTGKNVVVEFGSDLLEIKTDLVSSSANIETISIVGMGGIGKTTLARQVYDDSYIDHHFDIRAWVTVSQERSVRQVLLGLLDSAKILTEKISGEREGLLVVHLYQSLKGRRYFIVLDDIWDTEIWDAVRRSFPDDNNGSRVLLTTRLFEVARYAKTRIPLHEMRFLNQDESWNLLCCIVFGETDCPSELKEIGKEIARNCNGLPLAIAAIGGTLTKVRRAAKYWRSLADNLSSIVTKDDEECMEILSLSYNHLPHHLKDCFLYMGLFPEDYEIPFPKLIRLWTAEGFMKPNGSKSLEELGAEYLDDLIERNLILVCRRSPNGSIKTCGVHDLLRKLCTQIALKEDFLRVLNPHDDILQESGHTCRRLSIHPDIMSVHSEVMYQSEIDHNSSVLSILCTGARLIYSPRVYLSYMLLRVLDLVIVRFFHFPDEILELVHLRYLALTYNEALPPSISKLQNLETLVYHNWTFGHCPFLPAVIWTMPKLRHLCITPGYLPEPHDSLAHWSSALLLDNLQTLLEVRNFRCGDDILKRIPNLKNLGISYDVSPSTKLSKYQLEAVANLHQLETLKLEFKNPRWASESVDPPKLAFPQKLKRLTLSGCGISWRNMSIIGALPNLEVLKLRKNAFLGTEWDPVEEEFFQLKYLLLEEMDLVQWTADQSHFPRLQCLVFRSCYKLKGIPSDIGEIPTLEMLELVDCHHSAVDSAKRIQEEQKDLGNDGLKVRIDSRRWFKNKFYSRVLH